MSVKTLWGWGGVRIQSIEFATAFGTVEMQPEFVRNTTVYGKHIQHFKGWRAVIDCTLHNDGSDAQILALRQLVNAIDTYSAQNTAMTIQPRYSSTDYGSNSAYFLCFLDSSIKPEDIAKVNVGQSLKLKFIGESLLPTLPDNYSGQVSGGWIDENSQSYVDESGDTYEMF